MAAELTSLGYIVLGVNDVPGWERFARLLGLQVSRDEKLNRTVLRMDEYAQRIVLEHGAEDDLRVAGWELENVDALEAYVSQLRDACVEVYEGTADVALARNVDKLFVCNDPNGFQHEFFTGPSMASTKFTSDVLIGPGFNAGVLGVGHILVRAKKLEESIDFYRRVLGLRFSDRISEEIAPGVTVDARFFHTKTGRHHSLAVARMPGEKKLAHFMVEFACMDDVGLCYDRCVRAGYLMNATLGRHPNDRMFSFYVASPSNFSVEVGWGGISIDDSLWEPKTYDRLSEWGHHRRIAPPAATPRA